MTARDSHGRFVGGGGAPAVRVTDTDHGYRALVDRIYGLAASRLSVRVGILAKDGDRAYVRKADRPSNDTGVDHAITVLQVAIFNEFGTDRIPERSFLRSWFDENDSRIREMFARLMRSVVQGKRTKNEILDLIGQWCVGEIQKRIADGIPPANAPSTIAQKHSSKPLIDTGVLRSSISYEVNGR